MEQLSTNHLLADKHYALTISLLKSYHTYTSEPYQD